LAQACHAPFTDWQGPDIGDNNPQDANSVGILDDNSIIIHPAMEIPGVDTTTDLAKIAGVDPDFDVEPTGVDMDTNLSRCKNTSGCIYFYGIVCTKTNYCKIHLSNNKMLW
jgi:hypothetical protein